MTWNHLKKFVPQFPKPKDMKRKRDAVHVYYDAQGKVEREVCDLSTHLGKIEYITRMMEMAERQMWFCRLCLKPMSMTLADVTFDHEDGRGMNGSHRDDRIVKDGKPYNGAVHLKCNGEKGSKRGYAA